MLTIGDDRRKISYVIKTPDDIDMYPPYWLSSKEGTYHNTALFCYPEATNSGLDQSSKAVGRLNYKTMKRGSGYGKRPV